MSGNVTRRKKIKQTQRQSENIKQKGVYSTLIGELNKQ